MTLNIFDFRRYVRTLAVAFVLGAATTPAVCAQSPTPRLPNQNDTSHTSLWPYIYSFTGQTADVWTKRIAISRGCVEANTYAYRSELPTTGRLVMTKALMVGPSILTMMWFDKHGHHKASKVVGILSGSVGGSIATWNMSIDCRPLN